MLQRIPPQEAGDEHYADRVLQNDWLTRCKNKESMQMRITWPNFERGEFAFKALGYKVEDASAEDWVTVTVPGKQNSVVDWTDADELTAITLASSTESTALTVGDSAYVEITNTPVDAFWDISRIHFRLMTMTLLLLATKVM